MQPSPAHNTLGWMTAELGRQPWLIYGWFATRDGHSKVVSNGDTSSRMRASSAIVQLSRSRFDHAS
jgi:cytochrome bd-type quinol oxidase subunit 1